MVSDTFDVIVIGSGPVGENVADRARRDGLSVAIVESRLVGGECSYYACVPTKVVLRPIHAATATRRLRGLTPATIDPPEVLARRDDMTSGSDRSQAKWLADIGVELYRGHGRLAGEHTVVVEGSDGERTLRADHAVVLATGTNPAVPPIPGLSEVEPWTNREATTSSWIPERLVVLGGGVVACEMSQFFAGLGSQVTLVARDHRMLRRTEGFVSGLVTEGLAEAGVDVRLETQVARVDRAASTDGSPGRGAVTVTLGDGSTIVGDEVLAALGRRPATDDLGLESIGLEPGGYLEVDDSLVVPGVDGGWLYAVGDANGRNLLTHMGKYQARVCGDVIVARTRGRGDDAPALRATADHDAATQVIFTDPEVAAVGLTLDAATERGLNVRAVDVDMSGVAGAAFHADGYRGQAGSWWTRANG